MSVGVLNSDGWEYAGAYHYLTNQAAKARFVMIMPDMTDHNGEIQIYQRPYDKTLATLVDFNPTIRAMGLIAFAVVGHVVAREMAR